MSQYFNVEWFIISKRMWFKFWFANTNREETVEIELLWVEKLFQGDSFKLLTKPHIAVLWKREFELLLTQSEDSS